MNESSSGNAGSPARANTSRTDHAHNSADATSAGA
jgi:hypothetical protein